MLKLLSVSSMFLLALSLSTTPSHARDLTGVTLEMRTELKAVRATGGGWSLEQTPNGLMFHTNPNSCTFGPNGGSCTRMAAPSIQTKIVVLSVDEHTGTVFAELKQVPGFRLLIEGPVYNLSSAKLIKWNEETNRGSESYSLAPTVSFVPKRAQ